MGCLSVCSIILILLLKPHEVAHEEESELLSSHQPIVALAGEDIILPCHFEPPVDSSSETVVWTRPDLNPKYIHFHQNGRLAYRSQNPSYRGRTSLFVNELEKGNISLKLFRVKVSDTGPYVCLLQSIQKEASVQLTVGAVSTPIIEVASKNNGSVVLQCESEGWYPEPEVLWLDGEGNLLPAGPTETVRGPDDLYTVSSRVTVEKRHSNFTCRVQQKNINQTRETQIHIPADFTTHYSSLYWIFVIPLGLVVAMMIAGIVKVLKKGPKNAERRGRGCSAAESANEENSVPGGHVDEDARQGTASDPLGMTKEILTTRRRSSYCNVQTDEDSGFMNSASQLGFGFFAAKSANTENSVPGGHVDEDARQGTASDPLGMTKEILTTRRRSSYCNVQTDEDSGFMNSASQLGFGSRYSVRDESQENTSFSSYNTN